MDNKEIDYLRLISGNFRSPLNDWEKDVILILERIDRDDKLKEQQKEGDREWKA